MPNWKKVITSGSDAKLNSLNLTNPTAGATVFSIDGTEGRLFSITDELSGSLFAVSDISGIPSFEVFSDDTVKIGTHNSESIVVSGSELKLSHLSTQGSETDVLTINGSDVVGTRQLSSGAFATAYSLPLGTSSARGGFKIGYTESGKNYPVELSSEKMYVNVPWTDTNTNTTYSAGSGLGLSGTTFSHSDTSSQSSVNGSGRTYIQDITLDTYGHVTGLSTATETVTNTDTNTQLSTSQVRAKFSAGSNVTIEDGVISSTDTNTDTNTVTQIRRDNTGTYRTGNINLVGGTNVSISETSTGVFNISSTDTNTDTNTQNAYSTSVVSSSGIKLRLSGTGAAGNTTDDIKFVGSGATSVARTDASTITISSTDTNTNTTYSAGSGLGLSGTTFSHSDTSSQSSVNGSGRTYIQDITLDTYGHVTSIGTATETVTNTNTFRQVSAGGNDLSSSDRLTLTAGSNVSISESDGEVTISSTDTNTDTNTQRAAGSGLTLSGNTLSHTDTSSQGSSNNSGRTYIQDITLDTYGHVTGLATATETVTNTDTNTVTSIRRDNTGTYRTGTINLVGGTNVSISETSTGVFNISSTDTNTQVTNNNQISNGAGYRTAAQVNTAIQAIVDSAPEALDTLKEIATSLENDGDFAGTMTTALAGKLSTSGKAADSNLLDGLDLHTGRNNNANKVVRTDSNGYIQAGWINTTSGATSGTINRIYCSADGYIRYMTPANFLTSIGVAAGANNYSLPAGSSSVRGGFKIGYSENSKNYPVEVSSEKMYVNVPWTDTNTNTQLTATEVREAFSAGSNVSISATGVISSTDTNTDTNTTYLLKATQYEGSNSDPYIKLDANSGTDDLIQLRGGGATSITRDSDGQITISSTDTNTNTTYSTATSSTLGLVKIGYGENGKNYPVELSSGKMYVNVPWSDTNTDTNTIDMGDGFKIANSSGTDQFTVTENEEIRFAGSGATSVSFDSSTQKITISSTDTNTNTTYSAGSGLGLSGTTFSHSDTSSQGSSNNSGRTYIQDITLDTYGHVTGLSTATETVVNTDTNTVDMGDGFIIEDGDGTEVRITENKEVKFVEGQGIDVNWTDTSTGSDSDPFDLTVALKANGVRANELNVSGNGSTTQFLRSDGDGSFTWAVPTDTNTNTTYSAGSGLGLSGTTFSHSDTSSQSSVNGSGRTYIQDITLDTYGHVTSIGTATETVVNTDTNTTTTADVKTALNADIGGNFTIGNQSNDVCSFTGPLSVGGSVKLNTVSRVESITKGLMWNSSTNEVGYQELGSNAFTSTTIPTNNNQLTNGAGYVTSDTNTTYSADGNYGMTLSGTAFRLENDRRRNSSSTDVYTGNTHDYVFFDASHGMRFYTAGAEDMRLDNSGNLHVDGDVVAYSTTISDERLKDNVTTIENPLDKIKALRGVEYDWNSGNRKGKHDLGLIAQEVEKVLPNIVHEHEQPFLNDDDEDETLYKTVDYEKMVAVLIEGMKEQQNQIDSLKSELTEIKGKL